MNGILIINKPTGFTSHDVVAKMRGILRTKRIGHTGTLDPFATGVLVMMVGKATRLAKFLDKDRKEYQATVKLGFETDTGDFTGEKREVRSESKPETITKNKIEEALKHFRGEISQVPPMFSAKKIAGKKLYELARQGIEIERKLIDVTIHELKLTSEISTDFEFIIKVSCSAGTYIRTLAEDIGRKLGVGVHLTALQRTRAGNFDLAQAVSLEELQIVANENRVGERLISCHSALSKFPVYTLSKEEIPDVINGKSLINKEFGDSEVVRLSDENENLIAIASFIPVEKLLQPRIVLGIPD